MVLAVCLGLGWHGYKYYVQKGQIDNTLICSGLVGFVICIGIIAGMSWWANKPERSEKG